MPKKLILISDRAEDLTFGQSVAEEVGVALEQKASIPDAITAIQGTEEPIIFIDVEENSTFKQFEDAIGQTFGIYSEKINPNAIHVISNQELPQAKEVLLSPVFGSFISRKYQDPSIAGKRYGMLVKSSTQERAFGTERFFSSSANVQTVNFQSTAQKQNGVEAVKNFLIQAQFKTRMATVIANAVDELIMNAMFDAPVDELGKQIYQSTPRNKVFELKDKSQVEMKVAYDSQYVGITAIDHWGSLDKERLLKHISKRYQDEEYQVKTTSAGAGIGLATIFRSGGSFFFVSDKGARTEVTTFFKKTNNFREFKDQFRFISTQFYF